MGIILSLLLSTLPLQFGRHFWPGFSYVLGLKIDYFSPTLYLQDVLILVLIFFLRKRIISCFKKHKVLLTAYSLLLIANVYFSINKFVSLFHWLRITEFLLLGIIVSQRRQQVWNTLMRSIPFWLVGEFGLGLWQVLRQSSVGGIFRLFGERSFNIFTPGIAKGAWLGRVFLRPYGTFSHPNSLAGFILVCLILVFLKKRQSLFDKTSLIFGFLLVILSFSRTVWLACFLLGLVFILSKLYSGLKTKTSFGFSYLFVLAGVLATAFLFLKTTIEPASFDYRRRLSEFAVLTIRQSPFFGIGANNFIVKLSQSESSWQWLSFLQPVHNIFLLITSETGLTSLILFTIFLVQAIRKVLQFSIFNFQFSILIALAAIIFTGMFDHYWLTLIQNQLLFVVVLGLSWGAKR